MKYIYLYTFLIGQTFSIWSHHGIASLGPAGIKGPGAAVETSAQGVLPEDKFLMLVRMDNAKYKKFTHRRDTETERNTFFLFGGGYGVTSYFSIYGFVPYHEKTTENNTFNTAGFTDASIFFVLGFKYDNGFKLNPKEENLDELQDIRFSFYLSPYLPTGNANTKSNENQIDSGKSLGFGRSATMIGGTVSKYFNRVTLNVDVSYLQFRPYTYKNNVTTKFGDEVRGNFALIYRLHYNEEKQLRWDAFLEFQYLKLFSDRDKGVSQKDTIYAIAHQNQIPLSEELANHGDIESEPPWKITETVASLTNRASIPSSNSTDVWTSSQGIRTESSGGVIYYLTPGIRWYYKATSIGLGVKVPVQFLPNKINLNQQYQIEALRTVLDQSKSIDEAEFYSTFWKFKMLERNQYQGSEGLEKYRLLVSISTIF